MDLIDQKTLQHVDQASALQRYGNRWHSWQFGCAPDHTLGIRRQNKRDGADNWRQGLRIDHRASVVKFDIDHLGVKRPLIIRDLDAPRQHDANPTTIDGTSINSNDKQQRTTIDATALQRLWHPRKVVLLVAIGENTKVPRVSRKDAARILGPASEYR